MNRNSFLGWMLLIALVLFWSQYKSKQVAEERKHQEQQKSDSLAKAAPPAPADTAARKPSRQPLLGAAPAAPADTAPRPAADSAAALGSAGTARRLVTVSTKRFTVRLDNQGAKVASLSIDDIAGKLPYNPELISADKGGALLLTVENQDLGQALWKVESRDSIRVESDPFSLDFTLALPDGGTLLRRYTFWPDSSKFSHRFQAPRAITSYSIAWPAGLNETERILHGKGFGLLSTFFSEVVLNTGVNVQRETFEGRKEFNKESGVLKWTGLRRKYVAVLINFNRETSNRVVAVSRQAPGEDESFPKEFELQVSASNYDEPLLEFDFAVLPLSYDGLLKYNQSYEKIIFSGWEWFFRADVWYVGLCGLVLNVLNFFYGLIPNYGVAIILLTLLVRTLTFPLTVAQTKSAAKMQEHAPAIRRIRDKYKGQPQKANVEIMEYYKKEGVSPFASMLGCFPVLLQMPIFIALFNVLGRAVELKGEPFGLWINDLSLPDVIWEGLKVPYIFPLGLTILPFFMAGTMFVQMKMSIKDPQQKMLVWMMPIMMFVFSCASLRDWWCYWTISNIFTIGQTYFYTSRLAKPVPEGEKSAPKPPSRKQAKS